MYETGERRLHCLEAAAGEPGCARFLCLPADAASVSLVPPFRPGAVPDRVGRLCDAGSQHPSNGRCGTVLGHGGIVEGRHGAPADLAIFCAVAPGFSRQVAEAYSQTLLALPLLWTALLLLRPGRAA